MPDIMQDYKHLEAWDDAKLFARQAELKNSAPTMGQLSDEALQELLAIGRVMRRRTTVAKPKASSSRAAAPSLDAL